MKNVLSLQLLSDNNEEFNIESIAFTTKKNIISFVSDNTTYEIDYEKQIFTREDKEFYFKLDFLNKNCIYTLKEGNISLDIEVQKCFFTKKKDSITMKYMIESQEKELTININIIKGELV